MPLRVATDFTGIDAPIEALKQLKIPYEYMFASEIDEDCLDMIRKMKTPPRKLFVDASKRKRKDLDPFVGKIDLYVAGFPCQQYSSLRIEEVDRKKHPKLYKVCINTITKTLPKAFILENVVKFQSSDDYKRLIRALDRTNQYHVHVLNLNAKHYGSPQSRPRLFIVGLKKSAYTIGNLTVPKAKMRNVWDHVLPKAKSMKRGTRRKPFLDYPKSKRVFLYGSFVMDGIPHVFQHYTPCIDTFFKSKIFINHQKRWLDPDEALAIQGFRTKLPKLTMRKYGLLIGNSMCVDVLKCLFRAMQHKFRH